MTFTVPQSQKLQGSIRLPASKSYSIRAFFIAASGGASTVVHASDSDDAKVAIAVARALGCTMHQAKGVWHIQAGAREPLTDFNVGESGTSLRFLLPLLSLHTSAAKVTGRGTLIGRPNHHLCAALRRQGMDVRGRGPTESVPLLYRGGVLKPGLILIDGSLSSQFISALLIALPRLCGDSRLAITGKQVVSSEYIVMTRRILQEAGIKSTTSGSRVIVVKGNQHFQGLRNFEVPSDYGLAAFPMAAAALLPSKVVLKGHFNAALPQADGHILKFLKLMGARVTSSRQAIALQGPFDLKGGTFSLKDCPDLVPIMSILALFARGRTKLTNIHHARAKESDRISDLRRELLKVGARVSETPDALSIDPILKYKSGQLLDPHDDHRLAMAFTVLGLKIGCRIKNIQCVRKSYPAFVRDMKALGI